MKIKDFISNNNKEANKMKFNTTITDDAIKKALELSGKKRKITMSDEIMEIFKAARAAGQNELTLNDITAAYYNMFTKPNNGPLKAKHRISQQLFNMQQSGKYGIEKVPGKPGVYRLK